MKKLFLGEIKAYIKDIKKRKLAKGMGIHVTPFWGLYSSRHAHPLSECSEAYLDDKEFMSKAIKIDPNSIQFASKRLRQDKTIARLIFKKDKKLAKRFIYKKTLNEKKRT